MELRALRLDVHADFAGLDITEADRPAFVCRSDVWDVRGRGEALETLYFGSGKPILVRVYDKLAEIGQRGADYLLALYGEAGLRTGEAVQRVEAQVRSEALRELGVVSPEDAITRAGEVYAYVTGKWLRLVVSDSATRRERAQVDPRWAVVQAARVAAGAAMGRRESVPTTGLNLDQIAATLAAYAVHGGQKLGHRDFCRTWSKLGIVVATYLEEQGRDFGAEVALLAKDFRPILPA